MYKNRIRATSTNLDVQSFIRRCEIAYDERARYVEFVCDVWNEGRFGPDLADPVLVKWNDRPDPEPASFLDIDETGQCWPNGLHPAVSPPSALKSFPGRVGFRAAEAAFRRTKQMELVDAFPTGRNSPPPLAPNQGRGSP